MISTKLSDEQATPQELFDGLNKIHHFTLDAAANAENTKCAKWFGPGSALREDALLEPWPTNERIWLNPPYSHGMQRQFVVRARECAFNGGYVVALLPADTSTKLFHELIYGKHHIEFLKGRIKFNGRPTAAKFGSMLVYFMDRLCCPRPFRGRVIL